VCASACRFSAYMCSPLDLMDPGINSYAEGDTSEPIFDVCSGASLHKVKNENHLPHFNYVRALPANPTMR